MFFDVKINIRFRREELQRLRTRARKHDLTLSQLVRQACLWYLNKREKEDLELE